VFSSDFKSRWSRILSQDENGEGSFLNPIVDIKTTEEAIIIHAEMPGVKKEDIKLNVFAEEGYLEMIAKKETIKREGKEGIKDLFPFSFHFLF